jgi:uncharacterized membrane protein YtjA (UPF0391 family)
VRRGNQLLSGKLFTAADLRSHQCGPFDVERILHLPGASVFIIGNCEELKMLYWTVVFFVIAVIAGILGFGGIAGAATQIAQILFFLFLIFFVIALITGWRRRPPRG